MGSGSSIFEIGPKKISDNEQRLLFLLASVAPLFIIHLMKDRFNDSYVKKVFSFNYFIGGFLHFFTPKYTKLYRL